MKLTALAILFALLPSSGCRYVEYASPEGRRVTIIAVGVDTSIGELSAKTKEGELQLKGYDSKAKALELAGKIIDAAK